ncbi:MAG: hypothetical protein V1838_01605 [Patescibacteria group bacterium]
MTGEMGTAAPDQKEGETIPIYQYDLPEEEGLEFHVKHDREGNLANLQIVHVNEGTKYEHDANKDGAIDPATLRKELKGMNLKEISIASILEKIS